MPVTGIMPFQELLWIHLVRSSHALAIPLLLLQTPPHPCRDKSPPLPRKGVRLAVGWTGACRVGAGRVEPRQAQLLVDLAGSSKGAPTT